MGDIIRCDGLWIGHDGVVCNKPIVGVCLCRRCHMDEEAFHFCDDIEHQRTATQRHERVYGRIAVWWVSPPGVKPP